MTKTFQTADTLMMVRPANFGFNEQTASNNAFQTNDTSRPASEIQQLAVQEFDAFVEKLREAGVNVLVVEDTAEPVKADTIFPNNWVTFHQDGHLITYPMYAPVRRLERREDVLERLSAHYTFSKRIHLEDYERENRFLEGTGSMILDRPNKIVYACLSPRTDKDLLHEYCAIIGYEMVAFTALDANGQEIYHTNVMMALGEAFVVICLDTLHDPSERRTLMNKFAATGKEVIEITLDQMLHFAGNMLQVRNQAGDTFLVMSEQAFKSLTPAQIVLIEKHTNILYSPIPTIETYGGGSARCMMAEVFLPNPSEH